MAKKKITTQTPAHASGELAAEVDAEVRIEIGRRATCQIASLLRMLMRESKVEHHGYGFEDVLLPNLSRIEALNSLAMSVLGKDENRTNIEMAEVLYGSSEEVSHG